MAEVTRILLWVFGAVGVAVLVLVTGWFRLVSPERDEAADLRSQHEQQVSENADLRAELASLRRLEQQLPAQRARLAELAEALPDDPRLPTLIRTLTATAASAGADLTTIAPGLPLVVGTTKAAGVPRATTPARGGAAGADSQATLQSVPLGLTLSGTYAEVTRFLHLLEKVDRSFVVNGFTLGRSGSVASTFTSTSAEPSTTPGTSGEPTAGRGPITIDLAGEVFLVSAEPPSDARREPAPGTP